MLEILAGKNNFCFFLNQGCLDDIWNVHVNLFNVCFFYFVVGRSSGQVGIEKEILKSGKGPKPVPGQYVTVHCTGYGKNGDLSKKFWSTKDWGQKPFSFVIGQQQVIAGWDEGVLGMALGEVARLKCSPDYAYGAAGFPEWGIQPNSTLLFEIEVLKIV